MIVDDFEFEVETLVNGIQPSMIKAIVSAPSPIDLPEYERFQRQLDIVRQTFSQFHTISLYGFSIEDNQPFLVISSGNTTPSSLMDISAISNAFQHAKTISVSALISNNLTQTTVYSPIVDESLELILGVIEIVFPPQPRGITWSSSIFLPIFLTLILCFGLFFYSFFYSRFPQHKPLINALFTGFICVQLTTLFAAHVFFTESYTRHQSFQNLVITQIRSTYLEMHSQIDMPLDYLSHLFEGSEEITREEFHDYLEPLNDVIIVENWLWIPYVPGEKRAEFEEIIKTTDITDFSIWQLSTKGEKEPTVSSTQDSYPILYIEPQMDNLSLIGYDLASDPIQRAAIEDAIATRLQTISLFNESIASHGLILYKPVFHLGDSQDLIGLVAADIPVRSASDIKYNSQIASEGMDFSHCLYLARQQANPQLLSYGNSVCALPSDQPILAPADSIYRVEAIQSPLFSNGEVFLLEYIPTTGFLAQFPFIGTITVILCGISISILLGILVKSIIDQRATLEQMVIKRTAELQESEAKFRNLFHNNHTVMMLIDPQDGKIMDANPAASGYYGWTHQELLKMRMSQINILDDAILHKKAQDAIHKKQTRCEFKHTLANGEIRDVEVFNGPIQIEGQTFLFAIIHDISKRKRAEREMDTNQQRLRSLVEILQYQTDNIQDFLDHALEKAIALTDSILGYIYFYDEDTQLFTLNSWSKEVMNSCNIQNPAIVYELEKTGIWGEAVRQRKAIILNDFQAPHPMKKGYPAGHAPLSRFLTVPIISSGKIVAVVGVANKNDPYTETDVLQVTLLMEAIWNIAEQRRIEFELVNSEQKLRELTNATQDMVFLKDAQFRYIMINEANLQFFNKSEEDVMDKTDFDLMPKASAKNCRESDKRTLKEKRVVVTIEPVGNRIYETRKFPVPLGKEVGIGGFIHDITEQVQSEKVTLLQSSALNAAADGMVISGINNIIEWVNPAFCQMVGYTKEECIGHDITSILDSDLNPKTLYEKMRSTLNSGKIWHGQLLQKRKDGTHFVQEQLITPVRDNEGKITHFIDVLRDVSERERREQELHLVAEISAALRTAENRNQIIQNLLDALIQYFEVEGTSIQIIDYDRELFITEEGRGIWKNLKGLERPLKQGVSYQVFLNQKSFLTKALERDVPAQDTQFMENCTSLAAAPLITKKRVMGLLWIGSARNLGENDLRLLTAAANIAANALQRAELFEQSLQKVDQLDALRIIDQTINSSLDLQFTLNVILEQTKRLLGVDTIAILRYHEREGILKVAADRGFNHEGLGITEIPTNDELIKKILNHPEILEENELPAYEKTQLLEYLEANGFIGSHSVPLIINDEIKGVLVVFHRQAYTATQEWKNIFENIAAQTAIAIDHSELLMGLQSANVNLMKAYDETIEGWAHALEIRDQETEGHSRRVTDMTITLARLMGVEENQIEDIKRGALLHDIGKMSIPDSILNKPGPLDTNEWIMMREHPTIAYHLLQSIDYMKNALVIPYCHHEKWDGSGYPQGLVGEQIPLAARIFAVVDVYDALTSDRPYRKAWSVEDTLEYIREQSGKHFDPQIVSVFLEKIHPENL